MQSTNDQHRHAAVRASARQQFDKWALSYDRSKLNELVFYPTVRLVQEEVYRWQEHRGGGTFDMLDVGCGTGTLVNLMAQDEDARRLVGLDYSPVMVQHLAEKTAQSPYGEKIDAIEGDSEHLPFEPESFDVISCCNSFHHYPHQAAVIEGFHRALRPGGVLILVDGFRDNVVGWVVFDVFVAGIEKDVHHAPWSEVRDMIQAAGFSTLRQRKLNVLAPLLVSIATK